MIQNNNLFVKHWAYLQLYRVQMTALLGAWVTTGGEEPLLTQRRGDTQTPDSPRGQTRFVSQVFKIENNVYF